MSEEGGGDRGKSYNLHTDGGEQEMLKQLFHTVSEGVVCFSSVLLLVVLVLLPPLYSYDSVHMQHRRPHPVGDDSQLMSGGPVLPARPMAQYTCSTADRSL